VLPESKAARIQRATEAVQNGVLDPVKHGDKVRRMMEFGDYGEIWEDQDADVQKARRENKKLIAGIMTNVDTFDDDLAHMSVHDRYRKSTDYEQMDPQIRAIFDAHCNQHLDKQSTLAQLQAQPAGGASPTPGAPAGVPLAQSAPPGMSSGGGGV
jgi:hypothetical protein